ncbi:MAG: hypothetical protein ACUVX8_10835 [Candidatus Zipacnadales bacterium]
MRTAYGSGPGEHSLPGQIFPWWGVLLLFVGGIVVFTAVSLKAYFDRLPERRPKTPPSTGGIEFAPQHHRSWRWETVPPPAVTPVVTRRAVGDATTLRHSGPPRHTSDHISPSQAALPTPVDTPSSRAPNGNAKHRDSGASTAPSGAPEPANGASQGRKGGKPSPPTTVMMAKTVTVEICTETDLRANPYCPNVRQTTVYAEAVPEVCTRHKAPSETQTFPHAVCVQTGLLANPFCPDVEMREFPVDNLPRTCTVHGPATQPADTVTVTLCSQTGLLATPFCPETKTTIVSRTAIPQTCNLHTRP